MKSALVAVSVRGAMALANNKAIRATNAKAREIAARVRAAVTISANGHETQALDET